MTNKCSYLSVKGSTADEDSLLWCQGHPAPVAPTGQSAALWVDRSGKNKVQPQRKNAQHIHSATADLSVVTFALYGKLYLYYTHMYVVSN